MMDVVGLGALNWDRLYFVERPAGPGEEVPVESISEGPGGSAANTIVGLARLGLETGFVGRVGTDAEGRLILDDLEREGVDTSRVKRVEGRSGMIAGVVEKGGERALYAYPGVNRALALEEDDVDYIMRSRFLHMSSFVGEASFEAQKGLLDRIRGVRLSLAPGSLYVSRGLGQIGPLIERAEVLFLNREETEALTGRGYRAGAGLLHEMGAKIVAVTLGARGCYVLAGGKGVKIRAHPTTVVDTTGAGDAFAAGFLYGLLGGRKPEEAARLGSMAASMCIARPGAREGLPRAGDLE
ncbi:MAG: carbohydrate kinase family protein [Acidobacteria bacterium]|nr:carbohydrate kinase family protein [Acidobacteriota bacterium]